METEVELAVAGAREPMAVNISGRYVDRGGAGVGGERGRGAEPIDRADPAEDLASRQRADTDQVGQSGAGVVNRGWMSAAALAMRRPADVSQRPGRRQGYAGFCRQHREDDSRAKVRRPAQP